MYLNNKETGIDDVTKQESSQEQSNNIETLDIQFFMEIYLLKWNDFFTNEYHGIGKEMVKKMDLERNDCYRELRSVNDQCKKYLYYHIILTMTDGCKMDGIIEDVDTDYITMLVGEDVMEENSENQSDEQRQYHDYNRPRRRFRRFRRRRLPIHNLASIALLPYVFPRS